LDSPCTGLLIREVTDSEGLDNGGQGPRLTEGEGKNTLRACMRVPGFEVKSYDVDFSFMNHDSYHNQ
jgi:hypothetical protein